MEKGRGRRGKMKKSKAYCCSNGASERKKICKKRKHHKYDFRQRNFPHFLLIDSQYF